MWSKEKAFQTDDELQAELRALVDIALLNNGMSIYTEERYERLLREIYKRGLEPAAKLVPKN